MSDARPPGAAPPPRPSARQVAENALVLAEWFPESAVLAHLRADPRIAWWMTFLEAQRQYRGLRQGGVGSVQARRMVGARVGRDERTLRRWPGFDD